MDSPPPVMLRDMARRAVFAFVCLGVIGCGTAPSVRPIGEGERAITLSSGGPVTSIYGIEMPVPYAVLRYRQGLTEHTDCHAGVHPTMLILGNVGVDVGFTRLLVRQSGYRPCFCLEGSVYGFYHLNDLASVRVYPEMSVLASFRLGGRQELFYFGAHNMAQLARPYLVSAPFLGLERPLRKVLLLNLEAKWYGVNEESEDRVVDYEIKPLGLGAVGFVWGVSYKF